MFNYFYKLEGKTPVRCQSTGEWDQWLRTAKYGVRAHRFKTDNEWIEVITIFTGIDFDVFYKYKKPLLFETRIIGGEWDGRTLRCSTWEQAEKQHEDALQLLFSVTVP